MEYPGLWRQGALVETLPSIRGAYGLSSGNARGPDDVLTCLRRYSSMRKLYRLTTAYS